jgi:predicted glutamine amidotransferase
MCRLLAYAASADTTFAEIVGDGFENFVAMSDEHKDGWGITSIDKSGEVTRTVDLERAVASSTFVNVKDRPADSGLLHLRLASKGLTIDIKNNHPFVDGTYSFMHNGTIRPMEAVEAFIDPEFAGRAKSSTDSERYFYVILSEIKKHGLVDGLRSAVTKISDSCDFSSINCMLLTPEYLIAVCEYNESDQSEWTVNSHYELRYRTDLSGVVISSTGWGHDDWSVLANHQVLVVDRATLNTEILPLPLRLEA